MPLFGARTNVDGYDIRRSAVGIDDQAVQTRHVDHRAAGIIGRVAEIDRGVVGRCGAEGQSGEGQRAAEVLAGEDGAARGDADVAGTARAAQGGRAGHAHRAGGV